MIVVHVTHEAVEKVGGIGAVLAGLMTSDAYQQKVSRTIMLCPLFQTDRPVNQRLGESGKLTYSSLDSICPPPWAERFHPIERTYDVGIVYGTRDISEPCVGRTVSAEVLLVDVFHANKDRLNLFKGELYRKFAVPSDEFEKIWWYEEYVRLAEPGYEALKAIGVNGDQKQVVVLSHEYMGMPTVLKFILSGSPQTRTVFYAHEVASVRPIVEEIPGHDTVFYNIIRKASGTDVTLEKVFPSVLSNFKHPLVKAARYCDHVFAVGDHIASELEFLDPHFRTMEIDLVYNGIPAFNLSMDQKLHSQALLKEYSRNLFGFLPSWVFTHVARPVLSKGIWRDLGVLHHLEELLVEWGETAVYIMLGTLVGKRRGQDVRQMERVYGWPVVHERGYPDLCNGEKAVGDMFDAFNKGHQAVRVVFVNQWDWNRQVCGDRMPEGMTFADIRHGTDLEFGLSVYEPFGISQFEPLSFGALCVVSSVCGCMGLARQIAQKMRIDNNIIEADYLQLPETMSIQEILAMSIADRDKIESATNAQVARLIVDRLPRQSKTLDERIATGHQIAKLMSWDQVVINYFMPSLRRASGNENKNILNLLKLR